MKSMYETMCYVAIFGALIYHSDFVLAKNTAQMQDSYKKIADGLVSIRKQYPDIQLKVYAMLDQLDKLYSTAKTVVQKKKSLKKKFLERGVENTALKNELTILKNDISSAKKSLETARIELDQKLETEKEIEKMAQERKDLLNKISSLEAHKLESDKIAEQQLKQAKNRQPKNDLVAMAAQKFSAAHQPSLSRISTSEPSSPR